MELGRNEGSELIALVHFYALCVPLVIQEIYPENRSA